MAFAVAFMTSVLLFGSIGGLAEHYASAGAQNAGTRWASADRAFPRTVAELHCPTPTSTASQ
jgi:hypothetical protein